MKRWTLLAIYSFMYTSTKAQIYFQGEIVPAIKRESVKTISIMKPIGKFSHAWYADNTENLYLDENGTEWLKAAEILRNRCHVQNAADYLQYVKDNYSEGQIKVAIADIAKYVNSLDSNEDVSFILFSTNICLPKFILTSPKDYSSLASLLLPSILILSETDLFYSVEN